MEDLDELRVSAALVDELPEGATVEGYERLRYEGGTAPFESE